MYDNLVMFNEVFGGLGGEVGLLKVGGEEFGCLGGDNAIDAAVQRPPEAAGGGDDVAHREGLRGVAEDEEFDG